MATLNGLLTSCLVAVLLNILAYIIRFDIIIFFCTCVDLNIFAQVDLSSYDIEEYMIKYDQINYQMLSFASIISPALDNFLTTVNPLLR